MSEKEKTALRNIYNSGRGYIKDLREDIGNDMMTEFISVGFIICGFTRTSKTWRISELGKSYVRDMNL